MSAPLSAKARAKHAAAIEKAMNATFKAIEDACRAGYLEQSAAPYIDHAYSALDGIIRDATTNEEYA